MDRLIDIRTFTSWEYLERFCNVQGIDLVWQGDYLVMTERS